MYLEYATAKSNSKYKAGFTGVNSDLFDIEVKVEMTEVDQFLSELKKYLIILNKL